MGDVFGFGFDELNSGNGYKLVDGRRGADYDRYIAARKADDIAIKQEFRRLCKEASDEKDKDKDKRRRYKRKGAAKDTKVTKGAKGTKNLKEQLQDKRDDLKERTRAALAKTKASHERTTAMHGGVTMKRAGLPDVKLPDGSGGKDFAREEKRKQDAKELERKQEVEEKEKDIMAFRERVLHQKEKHRQGATGRAVDEEETTGRQADGDGDGDGEEGYGGHGEDAYGEGEDEGYGSRNGDKVPAAQVARHEAAEAAEAEAAEAAAEEARGREPVRTLTIKAGEHAQFDGHGHATFDGVKKRTIRVQGEDEEDGEDAEGVYIDAQALIDQLSKEVEGLQETVNEGLARLTPEAASKIQEQADKRVKSKQREAFNFTPVGVNPISSGSPHVRPMGRTCGEPDEIKKNTHPKYFTALFRAAGKKRGATDRLEAAYKISEKAGNAMAKLMAEEALASIAASGAPILKASQAEAKRMAEEARRHAMEVMGVDENGTPTHRHRLGEVLDLEDPDGEASTPPPLYTPGGSSSHHVPSFPHGQQQAAVRFSGVGVFLDFVRRSGTTRAEGPHVGPYHTCGGPNELELTCRVPTGYCYYPLFL